MRLRMIGALTVLFLLAGPVALSAQNITPQDMNVRPAPAMEHICTFEPTDFNSGHFIGHREVAGKNASLQTSSEFNVTYVNECNGQTWPNQAVQAFEYAMSIWETHLQSTVPVRIEATWEELEDDVLGSAGPTLIAQVPEPIGQNDTWYSVAQASAMTGVDIVASNSGTNYDISITINCSFDGWYFGTDQNTPMGLIDFVTVVLHEIGHGIGFIGSVRADEDDEIAEWGFESNTTNNTYPIIYDRFAEDGNGVSVLNQAIYPNNSGALYDGVTGQNDGVLFTGMSATQLNSGFPVPLYAPLPWRSGSSFSHLDQATFGNTDNSLMRPRIDRQSAQHTPGPVFCGMLSDMGWPMGANCNQLLGVESVIAVEATVLDFGVSNVGSRVTRTFNIANLESAEDPLNGRIVIENPNFTVPTTQQSFSIPPGSSINAAVRYEPTSANIHDSELVLFHNSSTQPNPIRIPLHAEALEERQSFVMDQNFPNPFNNLTQIEYALTGTSNVKLDVYNSSGQHIANLVDQEQAEGRYNMEFDGGSLASGMYLYRIVVDGHTDTRKFLLVK